MKLLDLFSGIGGFSLAASWCEIETVAFCEIDKFCQKVLNKNFPGIEIYEDITKLNGKDITEKYGAIDIITGGFPCQDISIAKVKDRNFLDGERSSLFYEMLRVIKEVNPKWIVYENSPQIIKNGLKIIHKELRSLNYVSIGERFTAREFGFPHKRERYYGISVADSGGFGLQKALHVIEYTRKNTKQEISRSFQTNKAKLNRTFSLALRAPSDSGILRNFDELPPPMDRDRIKALGNSVLPVIPKIILKSIKEIQNAYSN